MGDKYERAIDHLVDFGFVPQNAIDVELCLRITSGKPALARWIGDVETKVGKMKSARSIARRHGMKSVIVAARNGGLPKR